MRKRKKKKGEKGKRIFFFYSDLIGANKICFFGFNSSWGLLDAISSLFIFFFFLFFFLIW